MDSRFRGNDRRFVRDATSNDTTTDLNGRIDQPWSSAGGVAERRNVWPCSTFLHDTIVHLLQRKRLVGDPNDPVHVSRVVTASAELQGTGLRLSKVLSMGNSQKVKRKKSHRRGGKFNIDFTIL